MKKRFLSIILAASLCLSLSACAGKTKTEPENDTSEESTEDSYSYNMSYEEARHNPTNNMITSAIGDIIIEPNEHFTHFNIVNNNIGKIILSSDGVTDLISERRFKDYFINDKLADYIVKDAVFYPSIDENIIKTADNVSAIVVELQLKNEKRRFFR